MASGDEKAAPKAGHMAAPTTTCSVSNTLANGEPSTHGAVAVRQLIDLKPAGQL